MEMINLVNLRAGRLLAVFAFATALAGCSGDGSSSATSASATTPAVISSAFNPAPTSTQQPPVAATAQPPTALGLSIFGAAATTAKVGQAYSFQPRATNTESATPTFAVSGAPKWAAFSSTTGRLSGTPTSADVGMTQNIIVQVSNGKSTAALAAFAITVAAAGSSTGSASLTWVAPTQNTDGSVLANLSGYVIHYGSASQTYTSTITITNPGLTRYVVVDLAAGKYFFSMTATATNGAESSPSAEASMTIS
jgi:Putative Ig domain